MTSVDEAKNLFIQMMEQGCTRFGMSVGPKWHSLSIEEKCRVWVQAFTAPGEPVKPEDLD